MSSIWQDRTSTLGTGDEVTVEPGDKSVPGSLETVEGSFFAIVDVGSRETGSDVTYTVRMENGKSCEVLH